jgi:L-alanine-DL-glutamate epimerase-like enolase superfamily enzyme|tara:strand:- start:25247 stop:26380 length:1134 start_codon:yes stop_codon:yes gene_type:complete
MTERIKITDIKLLTLKVVEELGTLEPAWDVGGQMRMQRGGGSVVEVHTDRGVTGIGPGIAPALLPALKQHLVGQDPFDTERHLKVLGYYAGGSYRGCAGIDIALWDVIGKVSGQPLYKLWGGGRDRIPAYASMVRLSTPEERADLAVELSGQGWKAMKLRIHHEEMAEDIRTVAMVREAVGDDMDLLVDANQAQSAGGWQPGVLWDYKRALHTALALQDMGCGWLEEPLSRYAFDDLARLNAELDMTIAGGENNRGLHEFVQMVKQDVYDLLQPEGMVTGGLTSLLKIGTLAELFGKQIAPHHGGRQLGTVAHAHLVASWDHSPYLELLHEPPIGDYKHGFSALLNPLVVEDDGCVPLPEGAGLGVEIDRDLIVETA